ncbi:MAG: type II toxin-antitoxin system prevent-host-death family antitoxin [Candidatus Omnitrophica bacterium]|nr:type II toxin-antitoxin system prevent-host-death family antitoxin [Candidatus Omnitrophota bacterium]
MVILRKGAIMYMQAGEFKAKCLKLMDTVQQYGEEIVITKHGKPVAKLVPILEEKKNGKTKSGYGSMAGTITILGDIVGPIVEEWEPEKGII